MKRSLPSIYLSPPDARIEPPVEPRLQELPFDKLSWLNFERLCIRLANKESALEDYEETRPYGVQGDKQHGIDLFARRRSSSHDDTAPRYRTYQCKNEKSFAPAQIRKAVGRFYDGKWCSKTAEFVLCTRESLAGTLRSDEVERQKDILSKSGITFTPWDSVALNEKLKTYPQLVDDFFGREWVRIFCGEDAYNELAGNRPLTPEQVIELRASLYDFYSCLFRLQDPTLPGLHGVSTKSLPVTCRFVVPDICEEIDLPAREKLSAAQEKPFAANGETINRGILTVPEYIAVSEFLSLQVSEGTPAHDILQRETITRRPLEAWLLGNPRTVILGDAGSGKSSLTRFLTLDLLSDDPLFKELKLAYGEMVPVWIPFGMWTRRLAGSGGAPTPLSKIIEDWFRHQDEGRLWELVRWALDDERLVLIVDGLDEWSDEVSARSALQQLQIFVERRKIPAVVTSRPYGFARLEMSSPEWQCGGIAPLNRTQQQRLSRNWFAFVIGQEGSTSPERDSALVQGGETVTSIDDYTKLFTTDIDASPDLCELASTPLLLCLFIAFRLNKKPLPSSRFEVYDDAVRYLIEDHPRRRTDASHRGGEPAQRKDPLTELGRNEIHSIFANLAFQIQTNQGHGTVGIDLAQRWVQDFVHDENRLGLKPPEAREISRSLLELHDDATGLLVKKSFEDVGFHHRVFQEYLAAVHLGSVPESDRLDIVGNRCSDPQWHEVILCLCSRERQPDQFKSLVSTIESIEAKTPANRYRVLPLLAEIAFGPFECPAVTANKTAERVFHDIEFDSNRSHKVRLLRCAVSGLRSMKMKQKVRDKLFEYVPRRRGLWFGLYREMGKWGRSPDVEECLFRTLFSEDETSRQAAAASLADLCGGDSNIGERLSALGHKDWRPEVRAAALTALRLGWPSHPLLNELSDAARKSGSARLRYEGAVIRIALGVQEVSDRRLLWGIVTLPDLHQWRDEDGSQISDLLLRGWPGSSDLKRECLILARRLRKRKPLRRGDEVSAYNASDFTAKTVTEVLLKGFAGDPDIVTLFCDELKHQWEAHRDSNYKSKCLLQDHSGDAIALLKRYLETNPQIIEAVRTWLWQNWKSAPMGWMVAAAMVGGEPEKKRLIHAAQHNRSAIWPNEAAAVLMETWGQDPAVVALLQVIAQGPADKASAVGHLLPDLIPDQQQCRSRLLAILKDEECQNFSAVLAGLGRLGSGNDSSDIVNALFGLHGPFARYGVDGDKSVDDAAWEAGESARRDAAKRLLVAGTGQVDIHAVDWSAFLGNYRSDGILAYIFKLYADDARVRSVAEILLDLPGLDIAAVARGFKNDAAIKRRLLKLACPLPDFLRRHIVRELGRGIGDRALEGSLLRFATFDSDAQVHVAASWFLHERIKAVTDGSQAPPSGGIVINESYVAKLGQGLAARGPWSFSQMDADFVALLALDRLDAVQSGLPAGLEFRFLRQNPILAEILVQNWERIVNTLGSSPFRHDTIERYEQEFWETVSPITTGSAFARNAALEYWFTRPSQAILQPEGKLLLLAQCGDRDALLDACLFAIPNNLALVLMGQFFAGNQAVLDRITRGNWQDIKQRYLALQQSGILPSGQGAIQETVANLDEVQRLDFDVMKASSRGLLEVLYEGWPESIEAKILFETVQRRGTSMSARRWFLIAERKLPFEIIAEKLSEYLESTRKLEYYERDADVVLRTMRRRLHQDKDLAEKLWERLCNGPTGSEQITFARLLKETASHAARMQTWLTAEIEMLTDKAAKEIQTIETGFDLAINSERTVISAFLEFVS